ncbi:serine/threonine-protein kinase [Actinomadura sp. WMMB 499]|uniref:serine/threonine-protein kinase n=1 Tax=Actinomadura sp. WMMB 499 TaxID=1219491 RepID=UPI001246DA21|nr:serine/threonine-protein kinase [Actinomadura sp. WMMB 499]QFG22779.1 PQQ-binding-like beta-propeller repeat protein [Actinomadura sp. WMMB 499]
MTALEPGDPERIGRYRLLRRLGEGGMGVVYLGASPAGRAVAIKVVRPELAADPDFRARFRGEVEAARKVGGAFTGPVVEAEPGGTVPWLAIAYVNGLSLRETIDRYGPMPEPLLRTLGAGLGEALVAIHEAGLLHRDLKPDNILLAKDGPKVIDFGISKAADTATLTAEGQFIGSPGYMSPEQIRGKRLTPAADVFAYGAVLAFAATGRPPFGKGAVPAIVHRTLHEEPDLRGVPASLARLVASCLSRDPDRRPPAELLPSLLAAEPAAPGWLPGDMGEELRQLEDTLVLDLRTFARARTRRRLLIGGAAAAGLAAIGGGTAAALAATQNETGHRLSPPKPLWRTEIEDEDDLSLVVRSRSLIAIAHRVFEHELRGYSLATGRQIWSEEGRLAAGPALVYTTAGSGGTVVARDESRTVKWTYDPPEEHEYPEFAGPANGLLALSGDRTITGLDPATGRRLWTHEGPRASHPVLFDIRGRTLLGRQEEEGEHRHLALDTTTGAVRWSMPLGTSLVLPRGGLIFTSPSRTTLDALSLDTGRKLWSADLPDAARDPDDGTLSINVTVAGGLVYMNGPTIYALDASTGRQRWTHTPASPDGRTRNLLVDGGYAYVLEGPRLVALNARTGKRLWSADTPVSDTAPLVAAGGLICTGVAGTAGSGLYGWDAGTGRLVWNHPVTTPVSTEQWTFDSDGTTLAAAHGTTLLAFHLG